VYVILWEYECRPGSEAAFESAYGPSGVWVEFFRQGEGYLGTELLRDSSGHYATIDRWVSATQHAAFRTLHAEEYRAIDAQCEQLTTVERHIGSYETV